jgi:hypothetical protein
MEYHYCILPSGNREEFFELDLELIRRGTDSSISMLETGGRIYRIPDTDLSKLPTDDKGPYLGNDNSGHSIYKLDDAEYNRTSWGGTSWISLNQIANEVTKYAA